MSFDQRRWTVAPFCSSLREQTLKFLLTGFYFKNNCSVSNHGMCRWWQLLQAPWHTWTQSWSAVVKVMTLKSPFKQWEFSFSGEQGILFFPKKSTVHQFISVPTPYPIKSSILLWIRFLSQFYPHIQQWNKNTCRRKYKLIHQMQIWRTTRSAPGTRCMKVRLVRLRCFVLTIFPRKILLRGWSSRVF